MPIQSSNNSTASGPSWSNWGPDGARSSRGSSERTKTVEDFEAEIDAIADRHEAAEIKTLSNEEFQALLRGGQDGNQFFFGGASDRAWLEHARKTGEFVGFPEGVTAQEIVQTAKDLGLGGDDDATDIKETRRFVNQMIGALAALNEEFQRIAKYATDDQLMSLRRTLSPDPSLTNEQLRAKDPIEANAAGGWLPSLLFRLKDWKGELNQDDPGQKRLFDDVIKLLDDNATVETVVAAALKGAIDSLREEMRNVGVDLSKPPNDWREDASVDLARRWYSISFQAQLYLPKEEFEEVEAHYYKAQAELRAPEVPEPVAGVAGEGGPAHQGSGAASNQNSNSGNTNTQSDTQDGGAADNGYQAQVNDGRNSKRERA